jgi:transcriptional regulator with XRE-family HTH domain
MPPDASSEPRPSLAARLDRLFRTVRKRDAGSGEIREFSLREVAEAITGGGTPISHSFIGLLRTGKKTNIDLARLRALAEFFGVPIEYFTSNQVAGEVNHELDTIALLQQLRARRLALRDSILSDALAEAETRRALTEILRRIESMEQSEDGR